MRLSVLGGLLLERRGFVGERGLVGVFVEVRWWVV